MLSNVSLKQRRAEFFFLPHELTFCNLFFQGMSPFVTAAHKNDTILYMPKINWDKMIEPCTA